ncbi:MAG: tRNA dimethylallyltransferase [Halieaceae bacterium]
MQKPRLIYLLGPTASGKTELACQLLEHIDCEIISVDSALVYRGMDVGTAKPDRATLARAPHRLVDICDPSEPYSAAQFCTDARREIAAVIAAGRTPLLVGGTMLYFKALTEGLADMPPADATVRAEIQLEADAAGWAGVHERLAVVDPDSAAQIHPNHSQRLSRALEVYLSSGVTMTEWRRRQAAGVPRGIAGEYRLLQLGLLPGDRLALHSRIEERFKQMLELDLIEEVRALMAREDLHAELPAIRAVGYRQVWEHLEGRYDRAEMIDRALAATRQLAKRQLTWMRGWPNLKLLEVQKSINVHGETSASSNMLDEALNFIG